ncbi:MAG: molybdenum cofactor biosynthesis protein MoaE [Methylobacteriaceae bacterium]|jgi:molybdopterin synthase catalytic subunit|nr:molybdenum cofactor biosynthesis protein MoaE [Methylobacteriaceae bacterium]
MSGAVIPTCADIRLIGEGLDPGRELERFIAGLGDANVGAVVSFTGLCRGDGGRIAALELEHYPAMAERELRRVAQRACRRWSLLGIAVVHRYGLILPGETIVFVAAASVRRAEAFLAAEFLMDHLKTDAPFWKRERLPDGQPGGWVAAGDDDRTRRARWDDAPES